MSDQKLTRAQINKILSRHKGAKAELARRAKVASNAVSMWFAGGANANVDGHAQTLCRELLAAEAAAGEANGPSVRAQIDKLRKATGK